MKLGSLCSGAGGLDMAVEAVFGAETVWHCELPLIPVGKDGRVKHNAAIDVLAHRWPGVPNHGDLTATEWAAVETVDIMCAGWPCQPWSPAGKKLGVADERAIWPDIANAIRMVRPRIIVLENVTDVLTRGEFTRVADSLAPLGYDLRWTCLPAAAVGAPHRRERVFIIAHAESLRRRVGDSAHIGAARRQVDSSWDDRLPAAYPASNGRARFDGGSSGTAARQRRERQSAGSAGRSPESMSLLPTPNASDGSGGGQHPNKREGHSQQLIDYVLAPEQWGKYTAAIRRWENVTRPAPPPTEPNTKGNPRLNPAFSEWMMGWPNGWVTDVPGISRNDQLRIIGNGVVPQQATAALQWLLGLEVAT